MSNPLVAEKDQPTATAGTFLLDDVVTLSGELSSGSWLAVGLTGVGTTFDLAATVSDPIGSLIGAGLGWAIDHLDPVKTWFDELVGDPGQVEAFAKTYENIADRLSEEAEFVRTRLESDLSDQTSEALSAYIARMSEFADSIEALAKACEGTAGGLKYASMIVEVVHTTVRDALAQLVGAIISWAAEEFLSLGLATGWVIEQISTRVAQITSELGGMIHDLITSMKALEKLVDELDKAVGKGRDFLDLFHPHAARGDHSAPWVNPHQPAHGKSDASGRHEQSDPPAPHEPKHQKEQTPADRLKDRLGDTVRTEFPRDPIVEGLIGSGNYYANEE